MANDEQPARSIVKNTVDNRVLKEEEVFLLPLDPSGGINCF